LVQVTLFLRDSQGYIGQDPLESYPTITVDAEESSPVREVVARGYREAGIPVPEYFNYHFVSDPDEANHRRLVPSPVALVGADGALTWLIGFGSAEATIEDVRRTRDEELTDADPYAYAADPGGYGDHLLPGWDALIKFLDDLGGPAGGLTFLWGLAQGMLAIVRRHRRRWEERQARAPLNFFSAITSKREWRAEKLALYLEIETDEAAQLLESLGYERDGSIYRWSRQPEKVQLRKKLAEQEFLWVDSADEEGDDRSIRDVLRRWVRKVGLRLQRRD
jgi:hypothetical protein